MSTPESDFLGELFRCERFVGLFPTGMPVRACLRRQLDRQVARDGKGKALPPADWLPAKPYCATQCALGRATLAQARALGVPAETCLKCGSAQVGSGSAAPCAGCEPNSKEVPRGHLPAPAGPAASARLWTGEVPDVPIGGLGKTTRAAPLLARQHHSIPTPSAAGHQEEPALPAEEDTMPKGKPSAKRTCCESKGTRHLMSCPTQGKAPAPATEGRVKAKVTPLRPPQPRRASTPTKGLPGPIQAQLEAMSVGDLVELHHALHAEFETRQSQLQEQLGVLKAALVRPGLSAEG